MVYAAVERKSVVDRRDGEAQRGRRKHFEVGFWVASPDPRDFEAAGMVAASGGKVVAGILKFGDIMSSLLR